MPDINVDSDAQTMFNMIDYAIKSVKLGWDYCMTLLIILTQWLGRTVYWQRLKMLSNVSKVYLKLDVLATWYISVLKRGQKNSLNLEDIIIDIYYHFHRSVKRKSTLQELFCPDGHVTIHNFLMPLWNEEKQPHHDIHNDDCFS